eukprot:SAG11_NODE_28513_length_320_cov_6.864253_1_plen_60_part_01
MAARRVCLPPVFFGSFNLLWALEIGALASWALPQGPAEHNGAQDGENGGSCHLPSSKACL